MSSYAEGTGSASGPISLGAHIRRNMRNINVVTLGQFETPTCCSLLCAVYSIATKHVTDENLKNTMYVPYFRNSRKADYVTQNSVRCTTTSTPVFDLTTIMHVSRLKSRLTAAPVKL